MFENDLEAVLARARAAGVGRIVVVGETLEDARRVLDLCAMYPQLRAAVGLYPGRADPAEAEALVSLARGGDEAIVAIGEVGLDHWLAKDEAARVLQARVFDRFIDLAREMDLPLNVHSRSAGREVIAQLVRRGARKVQMHAFDGRAATALAALAAGYYFSVPPSVAHSQQKRKLVKALPLDRLLLETDSPVLGPQQGVRNEPASVLVAAREIAALKGLALEDVLEATQENTRALYGDRV